MAQYLGVSYEDFLKVWDNIRKEVKFFIINILLLMSLIDLGTGLFALYDMSEAGTASFIRCRRRKIPVQLGPLSRATLNNWSSCEVLCGMHLISIVFLKYV